MSEHVEQQVEEETVNDLNAFARTVWGNAEAVLKRDGHTGVQYIDLQSFPSALRFLIGGAIQYTKILVRHEYLTALHELETNTTYRQAAFVTGQPGIGKTFFLIYLLVACLGKRRPVAWEFTDGTPFYWIFTDEASFHPIHHRRPLIQHGPLWALSDSSQLVRHPHPTFYSLGDVVKTIQSTSPRKDRWKVWSKYANAECYVMDIWSVSEIRDLAKLLGLDVERMTALAKSWGGVPRRLLRLLDMQDSDIEEEYCDDARVAVKNCRASLSAIAEMNLVEECLSKFFFCRPKEREGRIIRRRTSSFLPTPTICQYLAEALRIHYKADRLEFFRALSIPCETRSAASSIFESWFHVYMIEAKAIQCHWLQGLGDVTTINGTRTLIHSTWTALTVANPPYYWAAPKNTPGIDSALVLDGEIYVFQVTIRSNHRRPTDGLKKLREQLPDELKNFLWRIVFIGDTDAIASVANKCVGDLCFPGGQAMAVGWSVVDPVIEDVRYREIREEDADDVPM